MITSGLRQHTPCKEHHQCAKSIIPSMIVPCPAASTFSSQNRQSLRSISGLLPLCDRHRHTYGSPGHNGTAQVIAGSSQQATQRNQHGGIVQQLHIKGCCLLSRHDSPLPLLNQDPIPVPIVYFKPMKCRDSYPGRCQP